MILQFRRIYRPAAEICARLLSKRQLDSSLLGLEIQQFLTIVEELKDYLRFQRFTLRSFVKRVPRLLILIRPDNIGRLDYEASSA